MAQQYIADRFRLGRKLVTGNPATGSPDLWEADDGGDIYFVKLWQRRGEASSDVRALWNREVRGLMRLQGYPGSSELFVRLEMLGVDEKHYFAVLNGGRKQLLSVTLQNRQLYSWLQNLGEVGRRRSLWEGLLRIAEGLAILHAEGTLHRSLSAESVFTAPEGQGEFRLSGFEWSFRVASTDGGAARIARTQSVRAMEFDRGSGEYSTATDWFDFGVLAAQLFGVDLKVHKKRASLRGNVDRLNSLNNREREIIQQLLAEDPEDRLCDDKDVLRALRNLVSELSVSSAASGRSLVVAVRLSDGGNLANAVEVASGGIAPVNSPFQQRAWIERDLRGDILVIARTSANPHYILRGEKLSYKVKEWTVGSSTTWNIGYCETVETLPRATTDDQHFSLGQRQLEIMLYPQARKAPQAIRDRAASWDRIFSFRLSRAVLDPHLRDVHDFFRVTQQLDTVLTVAGICPVQVISVARSESDTEVVVTPQDDPERSELASFLGMDRPSEQIRDWFKLGAETVSVDDEGGPSDDRYSLLSRRTIKNDPSTETTWQFVGAKPHPSGPRYSFVAQGSVSIQEGKLAYLAKNFGGTIAQIRRRQKAIEEMRSHESLLRMIHNPRGVAQRGVDSAPPARAPLKLDPSKLAALDDLWAMQPSFAIQGPPGTGKTTLIKAFADRLLGDDPSAQLLLTAHSHHTVDDVLGKLDKIFQDLPEQSRPILLRLGARQPTRYDPARVTHDLLLRLKNSPLAQAMPPFLQHRLDQTITESADESATGQQLRTMQALVQDAANLTFSTSNSAELEELTNRGRRFDWSIIEEAGKAHGFDMAMALQGSHRLLLIGDHFQLPPFNAALFKRLLADPLRVRKALAKGAQFAPGLVDGDIVEEEEDRSPFIERCDRWRQMVDLFATIFTMSAASEDGRPGPAATLTDQHRMHPAIAAVVGQVFYADPSCPHGTLLTSPPETRENFEEHPPFSLRNGSWLPSSPIIWIDVPWVQKEIFAEGEVDGLFVAPVEVDAVLRTIAEFRRHGDDLCEFQILSPYNDQLKMLRAKIREGIAKGDLSHLAGPPFEIQQGKRMGATVDEFQGSEADVVIVSLVRNNGLVPWKSIGFLREANRMNVLLSRARHKLVIVGSWEFFQSRCDEHTSPDVDYHYLSEMMQVMGKAETRGDLTRINVPA